MILTLALQYFTRSKLGTTIPDREAAEHAFLNLSDEIRKSLVRKRDRHGREFLVLEYEFSNPWYPQVPVPWRSALAQGRALSVLARCYQEAPAPELLEEIQGIIMSYLVSIEEQGVLVLHEGDWFYQEIAYPPPTHILNGHIIALWGLWDVFRVTHDARSQDLFERGLHAVERNLGRYDTFPWSTYDLGEDMWAGTAPPKYQLLHARQCAILFRITGKEIFREYA